MTAAVQTKPMAETRIRNIPDAMWRRFKALCIVRGELVNTKVIELVQKYVDSMDGKQ